MAETTNFLLKDLKAFLQASASSAVGLSKTDSKKRKADDREADAGSERPVKIFCSRQSPERFSAQTLQSSESQRAAEQHVTEQRPERESGNWRQEQSPLLAGPSASSAVGLSKTDSKKRKADDREADAGSERPVKIFCSRQSPERFSAQTLQSSESQRAAEQHVTEQRPERESGNWRQEQSPLLAGPSASSAVGLSKTDSKKRKADDREADAGSERPVKIFCSRQSPERFSAQTLQSSESQRAAEQHVTEQRPERESGNWRQEQSPLLAGPSASSAVGLSKTDSKKRKADDREADAGSERPVKIFCSRQSPERFSAQTLQSSESQRAAEQQRAGRERRNRRKAQRPLLAGHPAELTQKYEQQHELGAGGFGSVYAGVRRSDQLPVAIKHIPAAVVEMGEKTIKGQLHFIPKEVLLMHRAGSRSHDLGRDPWVSLLDWYHMGHDVVLVMERPTPAQDLFQYCLENAPLPEQLAKDVTLQLVQALQLLHQKRVFHRDIKMENILLQDTDSGPRVRLIDFGCGCKVRSKSYRTFVGTGEYAPPELTSMGRYSAAPTSVWQIGALLYELVRSEEQEEFTLDNFTKGVLRIPGGLSKDFQDFLKACLQTDPDKRIDLEKATAHPWFMQ